MTEAVISERMVVERVGVERMRIRRRKTRGLMVLVILCGTCLACLFVFGEGRGGRYEPPDEV